MPVMRSVEVQVRHHVCGGHGHVGNVQVKHGVDGDQQVVIIAHGKFPSF